jgi:ketosteroid isomerase-like protein
MTSSVNAAHELQAAWADRFNAKDVDGMLALAETESVFVPSLASSLAAALVKLSSSSWRSGCPSR